MKSIFTEGQYQNITAVLAAKDRRVAMQKSFFSKPSTRTLLDVKLNVPGPIKNNRYLKRLFDQGICKLEQELTTIGLSWLPSVTINDFTGAETFYCISTQASIVKQAAIRFEDGSELGRLFDADVLVANQKQALSRRDFDYGPRKCFLCNHPAKECARSRQHSVKDLQEYFSKIYQKEFN